MVGTLAKSATERLQSNRRWFLWYPKTCVTDKSTLRVENRVHMRTTYPSLWLLTNQNAQVRVSNGYGAIALIRLSWTIERRASIRKTPCYRWRQWSKRIVLSEVKIPKVLCPPSWVDIVDLTQVQQPTLKKWVLAEDLIKQINTSTYQWEQTCSQAAVKVKKELLPPSTEGAHKIV
jgi:hypothetical protein